MVPSGPPKSITVEDSFKSCTTFGAAQHILQLLAPDLLHRLAEEYEVRLPLSCAVHTPFWTRSAHFPCPPLFCLPGFVGVIVSALHDELPVPPPVLHVAAFVYVYMLI